MRRSISRIARISNVAEYAAGVDIVAWLERAVPIEMRVIVHLSSRSKHVYHLTAQRVRSDADDDAFSSAQDRCASRRKDVDSLVATASAARKSP